MFSDAQLDMIPTLHSIKALSPGNILYIRQTYEIHLHPGPISN